MNAWRHRPEVFLVLLMFVLGIADARASEQDPTSIRYLVVDGKTRPFQIVEDNKSKGGIISDIVDAVFEGSPFTVRHQVLPVNRIRLSVSEGQINHWITFDSPVWDSFGEKGEPVGDALFDTHHVLMTCKESIRSDVQSIDDLAGLSIVTIRHFNYLSLNEAADSGIIWSVPVDRYDAGLELVRLGRTDGFIEMASRLRYHLNELDGNRSCFREIDVSAIIPDYPVYLYLDRRWSAEFKRFVAARLHALSRSGKLQDIVSRYVPELVPKELSVKSGGQ
ncbi:substrate-binding periplasmic protein [Marinobacter caseinilyticus]|uniref:substrate-binding periplasmic protein n=1 Tax=Marinobacter caseinilyticus TaxID=2692195 RepID=UPI001408E024|nr:transporter substrate-binding domain-containing protein [Marinobacter caseinilyticus]